MTKAYTIERWDQNAASPCRMEGHHHARGTIGAWVTVLETGDFYEAGAVLEKWKSSGPTRATFNTMRVKIRP